jgi:hypothetical protein
MSDDYKCIKYEECIKENKGNFYAGNNLLCLTKDYADCVLYKMLLEKSVNEFCNKNSKLHHILSCSTKGEKKC